MVTARSSIVPVSRLPQKTSGPTKTDWARDCNEYQKSAWLGHASPMNRHVVLITISCIRDQKKLIAFRHTALYGHAIPMMRCRRPPVQKRRNNFLCPPAMMGATHPWTVIEGVYSKSWSSRYIILFPATIYKCTVFVTGTHPNFPSGNPPTPPPSLGGRYPGGAILWSPGCTQIVEVNM